MPFEVSLPKINRTFAYSTGHVVDIETVRPECISDKIHESEQLSEEQKFQLKQLLLQYGQVFNEKPGLITTYVYHMQVKPHETYIKQTYAIP